MLNQCPIFLEKGQFLPTSLFGEDRGDHKHGGADGTRNGFTATYICPIDNLKVTFILNTIKGAENTSGNYVELMGFYKGVKIVIRIKHMAYNSIVVKVGQILNKGDKIGFMGNTGTSTGAHAHVELLINGAWANPLNWLLGYTDIIGQDIEDTINTYPVIDKELNLNSDGMQETKDLQTLLNNKFGYKLEVDGNFGKLTETTLKDFQSKIGIPQTGYTDKDTRDFLNGDYYELFQILIKTHERLENALIEIKKVVNNVV